MRLTVDASVVVKWYVTEDHSEEARVLLGHRLERHAPDLVLIELANIFWKKARLGEIGDPQPYFRELARLREAVVLTPSADLIERAAEIAAQIDHPVYDCLYIACAEATESTLVTADRKLAGIVADRGLDEDVQDIGAHGVADMIGTAATALVITQDKVAELVTAYDLFAATNENVLTAISTGLARRETAEGQELSQMFVSPAGRRLDRLFLELNEEERIDLLALGWLGQRDSDAEWQATFSRACTMIDGFADEERLYVLGLGLHWRAGFERLTGNSI